jgi:hypothetical protein
MVEALFTRQNYVSTECFDRLRLVRKSILSRQLVEEFLSYIRGQMVVHQRKGLKGKRVYHIIRLLFELNRIIRGEEPLIAFPVRDIEIEGRTLWACALLVLTIEHLMMLHAGW